MKMEQSVPKRRHIKFRRLGIAQKKAYSIQNTAKVWNQELKSSLRKNVQISKHNPRKKNPNHYTVNLLQPTGHVMHHQFNIQQLYVLPTLYLCVLYLSENKQPLVPLTA